MFLMYYLEKVAYVQCIFAEILNILWLVMSPMKLTTLVSYWKLELVLYST